MFVTPKRERHTAPSQDELESLWNLMVDADKSHMNERSMYAAIRLVTNRLEVAKKN